MNKKQLKKLLKKLKGDKAIEIVKQKLRKLQTDE